MPGSVADSQDTHKDLDAHENCLEEDYKLNH